MTRKLRILSLFLIFAIALSTLVWAQESDEEFDQDEFIVLTQEEIEELFKTQQYERVVKECQKMVENFPWTWEARWAYSKMSEAYMAMGEHEKAEQALAEAESSIGHPRDAAEFISWRIQFAVQKNDLAEARKLCDEAAAKYAGEYTAVEMLRKMGEIYLDRGMVEEAKTLIKQLTDTYPFQEPWLSMRLAEGYRERGQHEQALEIFKRLVETQEHFVEAWGQLAETYRRIGDSDEALAICDQIIAKFPDYPEIIHLLHLRGDILAEQGDLATAIEAYLAAGEYRGSEQAIYSIRQAAECHKRLGEIDEAVALYRKLAKGELVTSTTVEALQEIARIYQESGQFEEAIQTYQEIAENYPKTRQANESPFRIAEMYWEHGQHETASKMLMQLVTESHTPWMKRKALDMVGSFVGHEREGSFAKRQELVKLTKLFQEMNERETNPMVKMELTRTLGWLMEARGRWMQVIPINQKLLNDYGRDLLIALEARQRLARAYDTIGDFEHALEQVEAILAVAPHGSYAPQAMLQAARCHLDLGNTDKAKELLETVIKRYPNTEEAQKAQEMMFSQEEYEMEPDMEEEYEMEPDTEIEVEEIEREMEE